ncbi:MAG TPA: hypothetical protein VH230_01730 [Stellaceae bacterium]|nr:hypothetical protein [Stellaceae bacterium]
MADYAWLGTPLAAITAAVITAIFAARQARTARNTLAEKLFDRRFPVYESTTSLLRHITSNNMIFNDVVTKY